MRTSRPSEMSYAASSPAATPLSNRSASPEILTPNRKIKALLARFDDSASESDNKQADSDIQAQQSVNTKHANDSTTLDLESARENTTSNNNDIALPSAPRGRLAARMQARPIDDDQSNSNADNEGDASPRVRDRIRNGDLRSSIPKDDIDSGDKSNEKNEMAQPGPKRRLLLKRKRTPSQSQDRSDGHSRSNSPLFFSSPSRPQRSSSQKHNDAESATEHSQDATARAKNNRFLELVQKHRKIRLEQEAADVVKRVARVEKLKKLDEKARLQRGSSPADGTDEDSDLFNNGANTKLSKQSRPTRKASKKALEEMNRETQRISRNMQLAHQAKTKKKITKDSFLARFNFSVSGAIRSNMNHDQNKSATASSVPTSDVEGAKVDTPPTSPLVSPHPEKDVLGLVLEAPEIVETTYVALEQQQDLPSIEEILTEPVQTEKGKGKVVDNGESQGQNNIPNAKSYKATRPIRVKWSKEDTVIAQTGDSDSDLEIITSKFNARKVAVFERLPKRKTTETYSHLMLRSLAHVNERSTTDQVSMMNTAEMEAQLRRAARLQAKKEREEKIDELKAKGVVIQTAEEREQDQQEVEDLVERARREAAEIQRREKEIAKKDGTFVKDGLDDDESDDEEDGDFEDEGELEVENISGSEEEDRGNASADEDDVGEAKAEDDEDEEGEEVITNDHGNLINEEVEEQATDEESAETGTEEGPSDEEDILEESIMSRKPRQIRILSDEDDDPPADTGNALPQAPIVKTPQSVLRSARKVIPGLQMSDDLPMGLTQAFAATMADSQTQAAGKESQVPESFHMPRDLSSLELAAVPQLTRLESIDMVSDSQAASQTQPLDVDLSSSQSQVVPQSPLGFTPTQASQIPFELTQDMGYVMSPFAESRFDTPLHARAPQSTVETLIIPRDDDGSPILQRKGRLRRGQAPAASDGEEETTAFDVMRRAAARQVGEVPFDKTKSNAKEIVDEAAEESEDEYAGLGGASDDDAGEEDEDDKKMIDYDEDVGKGDEGKLAGLFADRERAQDEAAVSKLLKDITTGALRRKRGAGDDLDLSDEEDQAARRREAKRREFARMRRELLKDEAVGKIAEDKKKQAFLKSIEDRDEAGENEDFAFEDTDTQQDDSGSQSQLEVSRPAPIVSDTTVTITRKRPLDPSTASMLNRLPPSIHRPVKPASTVDRKPSTLAQIRESVSFLLEDTDSQNMTATPDNISVHSSDTDENEPEAYIDLDRHIRAVDEDGEADEGEDLGDFIVDDEPVFKKPSVPSSRTSFNSRRTGASRGNVVDRLSLTRQNSSSSSTSSSAGGKVAFFTARSNSLESLSSKVPPLLRRATTNSSFGSVNGSRVNVSATGVTTTTDKPADKKREDAVVVRKGSGGRRNAVNYRMTPREEMQKNRVRKNGVAKTAKKAGQGGFLGGLFRSDTWG